jgi:hypothetical protein
VIASLRLGDMVVRAWAALRPRAAAPPPSLSLVPRSDDSRFSVLLYKTGMGVSTHVDSSSYYGNRIAGLIVLDNSANATSFVGETPFRPSSGDVLVFEGHRTPHNVSALASGAGGQRKVVNFLLTNHDPAWYRISAPIRLNRLLVNLVYYGTWSTT